MTSYPRAQQGTAGFAQGWPDGGWAEGGGVDPDLDAAAFGVHYGSVLGADPEAVDGAGAAKMVDPELHVHGADTGDRDVVGNREFPDDEEHFGEARLARIEGPACLGPVGGERALKQQDVTAVVHDAHGVQVIEVDLDGLGLPDSGRV